MRWLAAFLLFLGLLGAAEAKPGFALHAQTVARNNAGVPEPFFCLHYPGVGYLVPPDFFGNTYGVEAPFWKPTCMRLALMAAQGGGSNTFEWSSIETSPGVFNWTSVDTILDRLKANGVRTVFAPIYEPPYFTMWGGPQERQITNITDAGGGSATVAYSGASYAFIDANTPNQITIHRTAGANPNLSGWAEGVLYCVTARGTNTLTIRANGCTGGVTVSGGFSGTSFVEPTRGTPSAASVTAFVQGLLGRIMSRGIGDIVVEVSNEANGFNSFYRGSYADLVLFHQYVYQAVKAVYPWVPVALTSPNSIGRIGPPTVGNPGTINNLFAAGVNQWIDWTNTHDYPTTTGTGDAGEPDILQETLDFDELIGRWASNGAGHKPFAVTEWSIEPSSTSAVLRRWVPRMTIVMASRGIRTNAYYRWDGNCCGASGGDSGWQLYDRPTFGPNAPGALNTLGVAYQNVKGWLEGARFLTKPDGVATIQTADILDKRGVRSRIFYYSLNSGSTTTPAPAWVTHCEDIDGNITNVTTIGQTLTITPEPIRCSSH